MYKLYVLSYRNGRVVKFVPQLGESRSSVSLRMYGFSFSDKKGGLAVYYYPIDEWDQNADIFDYYDLSGDTGKLVGEGVHYYEMPSNGGANDYWAWRDIADGDSYDVDLTNRSSAQPYIITQDDYNKKKAEYESRYNIPSGADGSESQNYSYTKEEAVTYIQGL